MENKTVGWIIVGIAFVMAIIVWIFNAAMILIVTKTCTEGPTCTMYDTIRTQTLLSLSIIVIVLIIGIVIMFTKPKEKLVIKTLKERRKKKDYSSLDNKEKEVVDLLLKEGNAMFQADLMEKLEIGKVGVTRLLDKLEAKQMNERKRRGMNNIVVLKN
jgi:uncharacterized membrane protein